MAEVRFINYQSQAPELKSVLLVDDNDHYAEALSEHLLAGGTKITRARNAEEGIRVLKSAGAEYDGIITDITMETQVSGLKVLAAARRNWDFQGVVAVASTGLDSHLGFFFNRLFFGKLFRADYVIPKQPIKRRGEVIWIRLRGCSESTAKPD